AFIRENEDAAGEIGFQRGVLIVAIQDSILPDKQIWISAGELFPVNFCCEMSHAFADQKEICAGDGLVIELSFAVSGGELLQGGGKSLQRVERRILAQIGERKADMVRMV